MSLLAGGVGGGGGGGGGGTKFGLNGGETKFGLGFKPASWMRLARLDPSQEFTHGFCLKPVISWISN